MRTRTGGIRRTALGQRREGSTVHRSFHFGERLSEGAVILGQLVHRGRESHFEGPMVLDQSIHRGRQRLLALLHCVDRVRQLLHHEGLVARMPGQQALQSCLRHRHRQCWHGSDAAASAGASRLSGACRS